MLLNAPIGFAVLEEKGLVAEINHTGMYYIICGHKSAIGLRLSSLVLPREGIMQLH